MNFIGTLQHFFVLSMPDMPPEAWWIGALILLVLGIAATIDLVKGIVPDPLIFIGIVLLIPVQGEYVTWPWAAHQLTFGIITAVIIWGINELWFRQFKRDALGFGDAKWSLLAVTCFGWLCVLFAWGIGAVLGCVWISILKVFRRPTERVHFAPFLLIGLIVGLYLVRVDASLLGRLPQLAVKF